VLQGAVVLVPYSSRISFVASEISHHGAELPAGLLPVKSSTSPTHLSMTFLFCCGVIETGFSCE
jgi:hypothetical protein